MSQTTVLMVWGWNEKDEESPPPRAALKHSKRVFGSQNVEVITPSHPKLTEWLADPEFPKLEELFNEARGQYHWIVTSDLIRLVALYNTGGLYLDCDCFVDTDLQEHLTCETCVFRERVVSDVQMLGRRECKDPKHRVRIANFAIFAENKKSEFTRQCLILALQRLDYLLHCAKIQKVTREDVLWVCGPDVITTVYHARTFQMNPIRLLPANLVGYHGLQSRLETPGFTYKNLMLGRKRL